MSYKKILHVISSTNPSAGGPIEGVRQRYQNLIKLGYITEVVCCDRPDSAWLLNYPFKVYALGPSLMKYAYTSKLLPWLRDNSHLYEAVIVNGLWQYTSYAVWRALAGKETPYFVFTHGMLDPWFKRTYPRKHLKKWLSWPWGDYRVLRDAAAVFFTSDEERFLARESFWLYECNEEVITYGTSPPPKDFKKLSEKFFLNNPQLKNKRIFLFLSRIHEKKGCDLLIEAFADVAHKDLSLHLVLAGPGQDGLIEVLKQRAISLGIANRVTWLGMLQGDDKWGAFYAAEAFCLPSHQENFGIVVAEALACSKPVLISNKVNIWREIHADGAGIIHSDTVEGTAKSLNEWLSLEQAAKTKMKLAALNCFNTRFHIDLVAVSLINAVERYTVDHVNSPV